MKFDATAFIDDLKRVPALAQTMESMGFDALWVAEAAHNPYMALALAGNSTQHLGLGTGISVAFARSPMLTAYESYDLARLTEGRFMLGLGTQIKAHIVRRFSMEWGKPGPRMRDYILALRAIWQTFQTNEPLNYRGEFYKFTFITPFFQPVPLEPAYAHIPIYLAAVGPYMTKLVGELCDGMHVHAFSTVKYMQEVTLPKLEEGLALSGRTRGDVTLNSAIFVATNEQEKIEAKTQLAFYASTPAYRGVLELHGWGDLQDRLTKMTYEGKWMEMHTQISDEIFSTFGVIAEVGELAEAVKERYEGLLDRVGFYMPFEPNTRDDFWRNTLKVFGK